MAPNITDMWAFLATQNYLPAQQDVLRVFDQPFDDVKVLIVGQDPYPRRGDAVGLSFAVDRTTRVPRSLQNIYKELHDDLGIAPPTHGDLSSWADQGVLLLNRVLTVREGVVDSHKGKGWEAITEAAIRALVARNRPLVAILWGRKAETLVPMLGATPVIISSHPSPLAVREGNFFGSKPFSRANDLLVAQGATPIDWTVGP